MDIWKHGSMKALLLSVLWACYDGSQEPVLWH